MAITEGTKGAGFVSPNPLVGCVILDRDRRFLAKGHHARLGDLHAETHALKNVDDPERLRGAHFFVTLEPCAHEGRQPSCAKTLAQLPIASVTYGLRDPNPLVAGKGAEILRQAGIEVHLFSELQEELEELAEIFLMNMRHSRPFVAIKVAASLDGQVALSDGSSQWITAEKARAEVQTLRGQYDCVLTGAGTFLHDDPRLNARDPRFEKKPQRLVILDPSGSILEKLGSSRALTVRRPEDITIVTQKGISVPGPYGHIQLPFETGAFALQALLVKLRDRGLGSVFVEAGPHTVSSFLTQRLADRLFLFFAPKIIGRGKSWTAGLEIPELGQAVQLESSKVRPIGEDWLLTGRLHYRS